MSHNRSQLHRIEERLKHILRDQVAEFASLLEVIISVLVLIGLVISSIPVGKEMLSLWQSGSTDAFQTFLGHAFNLVIGIEFIKMLAKHSPGSALEVLLYAIARNMILGHGSAIENPVPPGAPGRRSPSRTPQNQRDRSAVNASSLRGALLLPAASERPERLERLERSERQERFAPRTGKTFQSFQSFPSFLSFQTFLAEKTFQTFLSFQSFLRCRLHPSRCGGTIISKGGGCL